MQAEQANIEYFFRLLYNLFSGGVAVDLSVIYAFLGNVWFWVNVVGYGVSAAALFALFAILARLKELRKREEEYYSTPIQTEEVLAHNPRWQHIESLMREQSTSAWREAITEADILLDDALTKQGFRGDSIGEKLKTVDANELPSLEDAWEAPKVRNQIAHAGSSFELSETLAQRTIQRYERVFRDLNAI
jgi:hypothetical protein